jgi:UDP-2,4-diacetamido-2,4,6-trideoxy-beta-L-altropyranose hydrolase
MNSASLLIRADASVAIGTGHVMRCLALAQAWQDAGGRAVFAMSETTPSIRSCLLSEGVEVVPIEALAASRGDVGQVTALARKFEAQWVVLDGFGFGSSYLRELKSAGLKLLLLDDEGFADARPVDFILNPNSNATQDMYENVEPFTQLLLGTRYALLRREFAAWRMWNRDTPRTARSLLVTMGGSDPDNVTSLVMQALNAVKREGFRSLIVAGGSNPNFDSLQQLVSKAGGSIQLQESVTSMPDLMAHSDMAIIAAGGTLWELLYMSCPVLSFARNSVQGRILESLHKKGIVQNLGTPHQYEAAPLARAIEELAELPDQRARMSELGRQQVDGEGARRVCDVLAAW